MGSHENLTIVFTDIVGYTDLTSRLSRAESLALLRRHDELLPPIVRAYNGRRIKTIGDAMLLVFRSPTDAVHCGMAMQDALAERRSQDPLWQDLHIRVAINLGEVRLERNDVYGEPVNIAARLESLTPPDEVWFTEAVYLAMNKAEVSSEAVGEHRMKGIPEPVRAYRVPPFRLPRLMSPGDEDLDQPALPFSGAHLRRKINPSTPQRLIRPLRHVGMQTQDLGRRLRPSWLQLKPKMDTPGRRRLLLLILLLSSALAWLLSAPGEGPLPDLAPPQAMNSTPAGENWLRQAEQLFIDQDKAALQSLLENAGNTPAAAMVRGHLAYRAGQTESMFEHYRRALQQHPHLARDSLLAEHLVSLLPAEPAMQLVKAHLNPEMLEALGRYSGRDNFYRRSEIIQLLEAAGQAQHIDWFGHQIQELRGRSRCEDRRAAIKALQALGNPAAIPEIEAARGDGLAGWWRNRCLHQSADEAIKALRQKNASQAPAS